jgi:AbrB family looped-hinge helix DNA binding protein
MIARVSNKGQITIAAAARRKLGIAPNSEVEVTVTDTEITIRPMKSIDELAGILRRYAKPGDDEDWDTIRDEMEKAVAEEVVAAHARRVRARR